jgi:hypothetical protein
MRYTVWPDVDHIAEEPWPTHGLCETFVGKLDVALGTLSGIQNLPPLPRLAPCFHLNRIAGHSRHPHRIELIGHVPHAVGQDASRRAACRVRAGGRGMGLTQNGVRPSC